MTSYTSVVDGFLSEWKAQILVAAENAGMILKPEYEEDNTETLRLEIEDENEDEIFTVSIDPTTWATEPIWRLPAVSIGVFEGERANAKKMAKELAILWETMDVNVAMGGGPKNRRDAGQRKGGRTKTRTLSQKRRRANRY